MTIDAEVQALVVEAAAFARNSPWPDGATACDHVYICPSARSQRVTRRARGACCTYTHVTRSTQPQAHEP